MNKKENLILNYFYRKNWHQYSIIKY
jgi:hypothetical protein